MQKTYFLLCFIISFATGEECWDRCPDCPKNDEDCVKQMGEVYGKYCPGRLDERGCEVTMGRCIQVLNYAFQDNDGNACPNTCELEGCRPGEKACPGPIVNGCRGQEFCQAPTPRNDGYGFCEHTAFLAHVESVQVLDIPRPAGRHFLRRHEGHCRKQR